MNLHGGVNRPEPFQRGEGIGALAGAEQIYVLPVAWADATWWTSRQLENLHAILDSVKRTYNVDENRVVLSGVSDGGTGAFYVAMRDSTTYAGVLPLIGALAVLRNGDNGIEGELFPNNLLNSPFFVVNGGRDPLYPTAAVEPFLNHLKKGGVDLTYLPQPNGGHNIAWWPDVKDAFESFVRSHPRNPLSDSLTWESDLSEGTSRMRWLVIEELAKAAVGDPQLRDLNDFTGGEIANFGVRANGARIVSVDAGSNAASFGLVPGDTIVRINRRNIPSGVPVVDLLSTYDAHQPMTIAVWRGDKAIDLKGTYEPTSRPRIVPLFEHEKPSGRVDLVREGNTVRATTRGVRAFSLLLSPDQFDLSQPVKVVANGRTVHDDRVTASLAALTKWAATDNDRTMLFGAELRVVVPSAAAASASSLR